MRDCDCILFLCSVNLVSFAQSYNDNFDPARSNVMFSPPGGNPTSGLLPPPGDGGVSNVANGVKNGDQSGANPPVPTGTATTNNPGPEEGSYFSHKTLSPRQRVNLLVNEGTVSVGGITGTKGTRVALTFEPDQLTDNQSSQIEGILGAGTFSSSKPIKILLYLSRR